MPKHRSSKPSPLRYNDLPDWVSLLGAKAYLRLGRAALTNRLKSGEIPFRSFGRKIRIPKESLRPQ